MSVHFNVKETGFFSLEQWPVTVCAWRGCCIEVFARAEHSVADCLRAVEAAGGALPKAARHSFASSRLKALRTYIENHDFAGHGKAALERISAWEPLYAARAWLAHGEVQATPQGITIRHITFDGTTETRLPLRHVSRIDMLTLLAELESAQKLLHQQLGQIKALAPTAKPLTL